MVREKLHRLIDDMFELREAVIGEKIPAEARRHFRSARKEALLGARAMIDHALSRLEKEEEEQGEESKSTGGPQTIPVEG